ncbi:MAG: cyclic nucleotide-binding domain-containing protein [Proteobacteria bacterium]|nr:cyclic nucleotide-binding domain-containing protein [Pseudomonadota bacterium]
MAVDLESLKSRFSYLVPLNKLPADRQARLLAQSEVIELRKKDILFRQGDRDDFTFYVLEGELEMFADESLIKRVSGGDGASFQPLAQLQPRQMTAVAKSKASVLCVRRSLLEQLLSLDTPDSDDALLGGVEVEEMEAAQDLDWLMTLLQSELFTRIPPSNIQGLLDTLEPIQVQAGEEIIKQGEPGEYYFALQRGTCEVVRKGSNQREIRLAELGPGDTFGEEALISGARRNATVRMTSDGELARLTKADFTRLIKAPLLTAVSRAEAEARVAAGARWLDVRFEDEHRHNGLPGSLNIPLGVLRTRADELDAGASYVAYCDSGGRSSAAAFLLAERGFDVCYVEGGAVDEPAAATASPTAPAAAASAEPGATTSPAPTPAAAPVVSATAPVVTAAPPPADLMLEAAARASSLGAEVAKADLTIEQAQKMMAEAQAMKAEAERYVAEKLERERARLDNELAALQTKVAEAEGLKAALGAREQAALAEVARQQAEAAAREQAARAELERRQAEAVAQEQALRAEIERRQAEVAAREQATRAELERQQAEAQAREQAARSELERLQAEANQREQAARTDSSASSAVSAPKPPPASRRHAPSSNVSRPKWRPASRPAVKRWRVSKRRWPPRPAPRNCSSRRARSTCTNAWRTRRDA